MGKRRLVDTHTKPKNQKDANPIRYFQNLKSQGSDTSSILARFQKSWRHNVSVDIHNPNFKTKTKVRKNLKFQKSWGGDNPSIPIKPKFLRKKQGSDIQSILTLKSARKRHSIDTHNRMSKEATFHRYLQNNSAGRRNSVYTYTQIREEATFH